MLPTWRNSDPRNRSVYFKMMGCLHSKNVDRVVYTPGNPHARCRNNLPTLSYLQRFCLVDVLLIEGIVLLLKFLTNFFFLKLNLFPDAPFMFERPNRGAGIDRIALGLVKHRLE